MSDVWNVPSDDDPSETVRIQPVIIVTPETAKREILQAIRDDLGIRIDDGQGWEGWINATELADAIVNRLQAIAISTT